MSHIDFKIDKLINNLKSKENNFIIYNKYLERNSKRSLWIYKNILLTKLDLLKKIFINDNFNNSNKLNKIKEMSSLINTKINQSNLNIETKIEIKDIIKGINNFYFFSSKEKFFFDLFQNNNFRDKIGKYGKYLIDLLSEIISNSNLNDKSYQFVKSNLLNSKKSNDYILLKLKTDGFFKLDEKIDNFVIEKILDIFKEENYINDENYGKQISRKFLKENVLYDSEEIWKIWLDEGLLNIAQKFFNTSPILDYIVGLESLPYEEKLVDRRHEDIKYHYDASRIKTLKIVIYLSDVENLKQGPYSHVSGSYNSNPYSISFDNGFDDEQILRKFGKERIKNLYGKKGSIFLVDPSFIHRGTSVIEGNRKVIQLTYCNSLFGDKIYKKYKLNDKILDIFYQENNNNYLKQKFT